MTHHVFDFAKLAPIERYKLLIGVVVPRPIALVTSIDENGLVNAAPFSFFNVFSEDPAQIVLGLQHKAPGNPKDTTRNLSQREEFVVNMVDEPLAETMNLCATDFPADVSEGRGALHSHRPVQPGVRAPHRHCSVRARMPTQRLARLLGIARAADR
ncbi:MAG: flavin reductase family protein [Hyphomicrobiaceae bacterium]